LHSTYDVAQPLADWTTNGYWGFGEKDGVYKRSRENGRYRVHKHERLDGTKTVSYSRGNRTKRDNSDAADLLSEATANIDKDGAVINATLKFEGYNLINKRADWSAINFQYWSVDGNRYTDVSHDEIYSMYASLLNNPLIWDAQGWCGMADDDFAYWGTFKIWTGTVGYASLGDCQCVSSDFGGITEQCEEAA
jgi:hypothetical protein